MNNAMTKQPRAITMATNKKQKEIKNVLALRDEMVNKNIDSQLIQQFVDAEYSRINEEYTKRVNNYNKKQEKMSASGLDKKNSNQKKKDINIIVQNKLYLEEKGVDSKYIKTYMENQYNEINMKYNGTSKPDIGNNDVNFID